MPVKTQNRAPADVTPQAIRAFCARHHVTFTEIAGRYGCSPQFVSAAVRADLSAKPVTADVLRRIRDLAQCIVWEREL
jgi:hypothetical protein